MQSNFPTALDEVFIVAHGNIEQNYYYSKMYGGNIVEKQTIANWLRDNRINVRYDFSCCTSLENHGILIGIKVNAVIIINTIKKLYGYIYDEEALNIEIRTQIDRGNSTRISRRSDRK